MYRHIIILLAAVLCVAACSNSGKSKAQTAAQNTAIDSSRKITAYYFHTTKRCASCYKIETYSKEAIDNGFADAISKGQIEWKMVNTDEPANKHFVEDYQLFTKSLVLVETKDGQQVRWKLCGKVWEYLNDKPKFMAYVQKEVGDYLSGS